MRSSLLREFGSVAVYEPYPAQEFPLKADLPQDEHFDFIISVYVLNVMKPYERDNAITWMKEYSDVAIAAVRTDKINGVPAYDGVETRAGTFQKSFSKMDCANIGRELTYQYGSFAIVEL